MRLTGRKDSCMHKADYLFMYNTQVDLVGWCPSYLWTLWWDAAAEKKESIVDVARVRGHLVSQGWMLLPHEHRKFPHVPSFGPTADYLQPRVKTWPRVGNWKLISM